MKGMFRAEARNKLLYNYFHLIHGTQASATEACKQHQQEEALKLLNAKGLKSSTVKMLWKKINQNILQVILPKK